MQDAPKTEIEETLKNVYGSVAEGKIAQEIIQQINEDLELREKSTLVTNGIPYSKAYEYNQRKAINYFPPRNPKDDREVSLGLVHEKIISFCAIFLKYVFKRRVKCYDDKGRLIKGLGTIYDLAIEHSFQSELFYKKLAFIYWETFTQGNAFVLEDWEVKTTEIPEAYIDGKKVTADNMDYSLEFVDRLTYKKGKQIQKRRAVTRVLDGRQVIFGNPEIEDLQEQPRITLEMEYTKADAEAMFGTLKRFSKVPTTTEDITIMVGEKTTIFDSKRHKSPADTYIAHYFFDKENNRYNVFLNGVMLLPSQTPLTLFYPRGNYPISNVPAERLRGSIYARSIPAKTKFNSDFVDWALKMLANKFEQGVEPAILSKGKYTLTRQIFRAGQVTHGVSRDDYEKADPENKGVTQPEFSFVNLLKEIIESQTVNYSFNGELSNNATATEIAIVDNNQQRKLAYLLDGLIGGFMDIAMRRAETIESKYTIKQKETMVDGKIVPVYQNFSINVAGIENVVEFNEEVGTETFDEEGKRAELFEKAFNEKKKGFATEYYLVNPKMIRENKYNVIIDILPEQIKDTQIKMMQMWDEFNNLIALFGRDSEGGSINVDEMKKEYLEISGRPDEMFTSQMSEMLDQQKGVVQTNKGSFGKPTIQNAMKEVALGA